MMSNDPWLLVAAARENEKARRAAVERIIDTLVGIHLYDRHENVGYPTFSATGAPPSAGGGKPGDQCMNAAIRYQSRTSWQTFCLWVLRRLTPRQRAAVLLAGARVGGGPIGASAWSLGAPDLISNQRELLRRLGMLQEAGEGFKSLEALQKCARRGKKKIVATITFQGGRNEA